MPGATITSQVFSPRYTVELTATGPLNLAPSAAMPRMPQMRRARRARNIKGRRMSPDNDGWFPQTSQESSTVSMSRPGTSPEALMVPTFGRQERKGTKVPRHAKNFLKWRIHPITDKLGIPKKPVTFHAMRRTLGTDLQRHGTMKDIQAALRHASIRTTADAYVEPIRSSVRAAINWRTQKYLAKSKMRAMLAWPKQRTAETPGATQSNATHLENSNFASA
jgi:hypothetical protein